jgi:hypothetical protein
MRVGDPLGRELGELRWVRIITWMVSESTMQAAVSSEIAGSSSRRSLRRRRSSVEIRHRQVHENHLRHGFSPNLPNRCLTLMLCWLVRRKLPPGLRAPP